MNILFGAASVWGLLGVFIAIRGIDGYFQSFGAPGMTKIKTAWFAKTERGGFAGIFGFMINLGRLGIFNFGPALLSGFVLFGMFQIAPLHWKWLFWGPSIVCALVAVAMFFGVKETPEESGFYPVEEYHVSKPPPGANKKLFAVGIGATVVIGLGIFLFTEGFIATQTLGFVLLVSLLAMFGTIDFLAPRLNLNRKGLRLVEAFIIAFGFVGWSYFCGWIGLMDMGLLVVGLIVLAFLVLHFLAKAFIPNPADVHAAMQNAAQTTRADIQTALRQIVVNPAVWVVAAAYACTGAVRNPIDSWFARYMQEAHNTDLKSTLFQLLAFLIPATASAGSLLSGYVSDKLFNGARAPVAAFLYLVEIAIVILASFFARTPEWAAFFFVALSFTCNSTHSILGTAAAMDIGGRKMTGFASGVIDSFQYFGATLGLWALGHLLDRYGWKAYFPYMVPFGIVGFCLMVFGRNVIARNSRR
jgi:sugar phosphate permease